jgi:hypothetical protein
MVLLLAIKSAFKNALGILCKEASVISITLIYFQLFLLHFKSPSLGGVCKCSGTIHTNAAVRDRWVSAHAS